MTAKPRLILQCHKCLARFSSIDYSNPKLALKTHLEADHA